MRFPFGRRKWERGMDAGLRFHLDQQIRGYMERGLSRAEAERRARQEFGTLELAKDECRDQRSAEWLNNILRDLRHACRGCRDHAIARRSAGGVRSRYPRRQWWRADSRFLPGARFCHRPRLGCSSDRLRR